MLPRRGAAVLVAGGVLLALIAAAAPVHAQADRLRVDLEYRLIPPQPVETGNRIEVIDFFWYGCPYCFELQPALEAWDKRKPADVALRRIPAVLRESWKPHARIYYTLEALGEVERLHRQVYLSYHVEKLRMSSPEVMVEWAVRHGIDRDRWVAAYGSPETDRKVDEALLATRRYAVTGTPSVVVEGRYLTSSAMSETVPGVVTIVERLVSLARTEGRAK